MSKTKRRGNGEGSICKRGNGWCAAVTVGYDSNGKRLRRFVYGKTKAEVQDKLTKLQHSKLEGTLCENGRLTVAQFMEQWLNTVRPSLADGSIANYDRAIRLQINPRIGGIQVSKLTPLHAQNLYNTMAREGHSIEKRRLAHITLRLALRQAVKWGIIPRNVCDAVEAPAIKPKTDFAVLTKSQAMALMAAASGDRFEALYVVALSTGMRLGELFGLERKNVDLNAGFLKVTQTLSEVHGKHKLKEPKTEKSRRRIDLPKLAIEALRRHLERMDVEHPDCVFVFVNEHGGWLRRTHFHDHCFKPLLKKAGLPLIRFHDLRHTAATLLLQENVHPKVVQERLGHSQISVTLNTYSHVLPTMQKEAAERLDQLFARACA